MSRHLADRAPTLDAAPRLREFLRIARREGLHPAVRALHARRPSTADPAAAAGRLAAYLRIERGRTA